MSDEDFNSPPTDPNDPWIGQTFAGYTTLQRIGEGGMGIIYLARHESLDRLAAVKFLPAEMAGDGVFVELFLREAKAAAKLSHPNIVDVHDAGCLGEGIYYFIMEYVEGRNLLSILEERGPLPAGEALNYVRQAASALAYAHKKNLIHRDIKPENLLLTEDGTIKVVDLGLAKWAGQESSMLTQSGEMLGSPVYISPERLRDPNNVDQRADIYSLGGTFFHLVTGKIPYEGSSPVIMAKHLTDPVPDPRGINPALNGRIAEIIMKMMAKEQEQRYQTMQEVCADLNAPGLLSDEAAGPLVLARGRGKVLLRGIAIGAVVLLLLTLGYLYRPRPEGLPPPAATPPKLLPVAPAFPLAQLVIADFNGESRQNNLGGTFGTWNSHGQEPLGKCSEEVQPGAGPNDSACWRIVCGISTPRTYGGTWMHLKYVDGSGYDTFTFKAKTDQPALKFLAELKIRPGATQVVSKQVVVDLGQEWKTVEIPITAFGLPNLQRLDDLVFIFNQETTGPRDAVLWIDDLALTKKSP